MDFSQALIQLKAGLKVAEIGSNKGNYYSYNSEDEILTFHVPGFESGVISHFTVREIFMGKWEIVE